MTKTFVSRVDPLCDEQAAGLRLGGIRVSDGELVGCEAEGVVAHLAALHPVGTDSTEHGLLLCAINGRRCCKRRESGGGGSQEVSEGKKGFNKDLESGKHSSN